MRNCNCSGYEGHGQRFNRRWLARFVRGSGRLDVFHLGDGLELTLRADTGTTTIRLGLGEVLEIATHVVPRNGGAR